MATNRYIMKGALGHYVESQTRHLLVAGIAQVPEGETSTFNIINGGK